jgi:hypothetical protein
MKHPQKTPAVTGATKKTGKSISQSQYISEFISSLPYQVFGPLNIQRYSGLRGRKIEFNFKGDHTPLEILFAGNAVNERMGYSSKGKRGRVIFKGGNAPTLQGAA